VTVGRVRFPPTSLGGPPLACGRGIASAGWAVRSGVSANTGSSMLTIASDPSYNSPSAAYSVVVLPAPVGAATMIVPLGFRSEWRRTVLRIELSRVDDHIYRSQNCSASATLTSSSYRSLLLTRWAPSRSPVKRLRHREAPGLERLSPRRSAPCRCPSALRRPGGNGTRMGAAAASCSNPGRRPGRPPCSSASRRARFSPRAA
jgi:hypothetical protein